ncbi:unnamed protein product [Cylindrotheca closterium]|uniref:Uncharacterized protein n=1 Tax=Cylindrotheca closterium TaxID=2856 RepID=A0AAD2FFQ8_9STRA|nr:unnamed protein product [Cylindrotheca closterium]
MKRKLENQSAACSCSEASVDTCTLTVNVNVNVNVDAVHHHHKKLGASPSRCHASAQGRYIPASPPSRRLRLSPSPTRPVSPDLSSHRHQKNQRLIHQVPLEQEPPFGRRKRVRFNPMVKVQEISRAFCNHNNSNNNSNSNNSDVSAAVVPKSALFYSKHDYMKFYVREKSRLAFQDLTKRLCREQERRLRSNIRVIPSYFCVLNYFNAVMTINELGHQVKQQQQQQQQQQMVMVMGQQQQQHQFRRQTQRRRLQIPQQPRPQQEGQTRNHPATTVTNNNNNDNNSRRRSSRSSISNHLRHAISLNQYNNQVIPRAPRRNTVCAAVA